MRSYMGGAIPLQDQSWSWLNGLLAVRTVEARPLVLQPLWKGRRQFTLLPLRALELPS